MSFDWNPINELTEEKLSNDDNDAAQKIIIDAINYNFLDTDLEDKVQIRHLFELIGSVIKLKDEEIDEIEKYGTDIILEKERQATKLQNQLKEKEDLIDNLQHGGTGKDARYLRDELRMAQTERDRYQRESREVSADLTSLRETNDRLTNELLEYKAKSRESEGRCDQLRQDVLDLQKQLEAQRETLMLKREEQEGKLTRRLKEQEDTRLLNEMQELSDANEYLKDEVEKITHKLTDATQEIVDLTEKYTTVKTIIDETERSNDRLKEEAEGLRLQIQDMQELLNNRGSNDDALMVHVNNEIEKWQARVANTEEQLKEERRKSLILQQKVEATTLDEDKRKLAELTEDVANKDKQIEELQSELAEGYKQMKLMGEFVEELQSTEPVKETRQLESQLADFKSVAKAERDRIRLVEADAAEKDKQLAEAIVRLTQYENGTYGLHEAVQEIKDLKKQIGIRDNDIKNLTAQLNKLEKTTFQALDENDEMRRRLGLGPSEAIDLTELKFVKSAELEQVKAVNRLLNKEVEKLEKERIEMKKAMRKQALHRGVRAVELGLKTEDLEAIENMAVDGETPRQVGADVSSFTVEEELVRKLKEVKTEEAKAFRELKMEVQEVKQGNTGLNQKLTQLTQENSRQSSQLSKLEDERDKLKSALKQALNSKAGAKLEDQPDIARLLSLLEEKLEQSHPDLTEHLKKQVAQLNGRNMELREELKKAKEDVKRSERERAVAVADLKKLAPPGTTPEIILIQGALNQVGSVQDEPSNNNMQANLLSKQLILTLHELEEKEKLLKNMETRVSSYQEELSRVTALQGMMYQDYHKLLTERELPPTSAQQQQTTESEIYKAELDRMCKVMEGGSDERARSAAEVSRKLILLKVSEKSLRRELASSREITEIQEREINRLQQVEEYLNKELAERLSWLEQYKNTAKSHILQLRNELLTSVPQEDVEKLLAMYTAVSAKYRSLLEDESEGQFPGQFPGRKLRDVQEDLEQTRETLQQTERKLAIQEQRCRDLEQRVPTRDSARASHVDSFSDLRDKLYTLELQLVNEKQRAAHATNKHSQLLKVTQELEERNADLERKYGEIVERNASLQQHELELTTELENKAHPGSADSRTKVLENQVLELQNEVHRLQNISDIAATQTRALIARRTEHTKEIEEYKYTIMEYERQSDDNLTIGLLTKRNVELQTRELEARKNYEEIKMRMSQERTKVLTLEKELLERDKLHEIHFNRIKAHVRVLCRTVCHLRGQFSGAVPLKRQQRLGEAVRSLVSDKRKLTQKVDELEKDKMELEVKLEHYQTSNDNNMMEVTAVSKARLAEMRLKREATQLRNQLKYLENVIKDHENTISELEQENAEVYTLLTEQKTFDIKAFDRVNIDIRKEIKDEVTYVVCSRCKQNADYIKDLDKPSKLVSLEVDYLSKKLDDKEKLLSDRKEEIDFLKTTLSNLQTKNKELVKKIGTLEEKIAMKSESKDGTDSSLYQKSQESAEKTIKVLNERLDQKEDLINRYQNMMKELREEIRVLKNSQAREIDNVSARHADKEKEWLKKYQDLSAELLSLQDIGDTPVPHKQAELEELVLEQDKANSLLRDNIFKLRQELSDLKTERSLDTKDRDKSVEALKTEHKNEIRRLKTQLKEAENKNMDLMDEIKQLEDKRVKGSSPLKGGKQASEKLRKQVEAKDKEISQLQQVISSLRDEMTTVFESKFRESPEKQSNRVMEEDPEDSVISTKRNESYEKENEKLKSKIVKLQKEKDQLFQEKGSLEAQLTAKFNPKQAAEIERLEKQATIQREKISRLKLLVGNSGVDADRLPSDQSLTNKIVSLEKELDKLKGSDSKVQVKPAMESWLDNKKWFKKLETQKKLVEAKNSEVETLTRQNASFRVTIERLDREKHVLSTKLRNTMRLTATKPSKSEVKKPPVGSADKGSGDLNLRMELEKVRGSLYKAEQDKEELQLQIARDQKEPMAERNLTIRALKETVSTLDKQLEDVCKSDPNVLSMFDTLRKSNNDLEKRSIQAESTALQRQLQLEQLQLELPRLRNRVGELESYVEVLKPLSGGKEGRGVASSGSSQSPADLERVINAMKRVVEKLQKENTQLKQSAAAAARQDEKLTSPPSKVPKVIAEELSSLRDTNSLLSKETAALKSLLDERCEEAKDLKDKVCELEGKLARATKNTGLPQLEPTQLQDLQNKLEEEVTVNKALSEQLRRAKEDMQRKNNLLSEVRKRLTGVVEKEADMEEEIRILHLCKMPSGAKEIAKEAVKVKRENAKLQAMLDDLINKSGSSKDPATVDVFLREKVKNYKTENAIMIKKIVFYQRQLRDLTEQYPEANIELEYDIDT